MQYAPSLVGGQRPQGELDGRHVRGLEVEDRFGRRRVHRGRAVARQSERHGRHRRAGGERELVAAHRLAVAVSRAGLERDGVARGGLEADAHGDATLARVHVAFEIRRAESRDAHLVLESRRIHRRREVDPHSVTRRVLIAVRGLRAGDRRLRDRDERGRAHIRTHAAVRAFQSLVEGDRVPGPDTEPLARVPGEQGPGIVPLERPGWDGTRVGVLDAESGLRRRVHRLVEGDIDLLPRPAVDPVRVGLDRVDRRHDRRERRVEVLRQYAVRRRRESLRHLQVVRRRGREVRRQEVVDRGVEPFTGAVERGLEHDDWISALR